MTPRGLGCPLRQTTPAVALRGWNSSGDALEIAADFLEYKHVFLLHWVMRGMTQSSSLPRGMMKVQT